MQQPEVALEALAGGEGAEPEVEVGAQAVAKIKAAQPLDHVAAEEHALLHERTDALVEQGGNPGGRRRRGDAADARAVLVDQLHVAVEDGRGAGLAQVVGSGVAEVRREQVVVVDVGEPSPRKGGGPDGGVDRAVDAAGAPGVGHDEGVRVARGEFGDLGGRGGDHVAHRQRLGGDRLHRLVQERGLAEGGRDDEDGGAG